VPGKKQNEQGSCRKKAASKSTPSEKEFQSQRAKQLEEWKKDHPKSPRKAAQHLGKPAAKPAAKKAKKRAAKKAAK
jgi:hypothetical protein